MAKQAEQSLDTSVECGSAQRVPQNSRAFSPGFRLSLLDVVVLAVGTVATVLLSLQTWWWGIVVGFPIAHFFLFCNVVRMARPPELVWSAAFVVLAGTTIVNGIPGWGLTAAISLLLTIVVVAIEMRKLSYHGIGWSRINPNLPRWYEANRAWR